MASFLYIGDDRRVYPELHGVDGSTLEVGPGDVVDAEDNPDPSRFDLVSGDGQVRPVPVLNSTAQEA